MENDIPKYDEMPMTGYDRLLTAEELSREMKKAAIDRKRKMRETGKTEMLTKTAKFLGNLKIF